MITPLARRLDRWVKQGIITLEQAHAISLFEKGSGSRSWVVFGIVGIGVTAIATGVREFLKSSDQKARDELAKPDERSQSVGRGRLKAVIKQHPNTNAAKEARKLILE